MNHKTLTLSGQSVDVEVAATPQQQQQGLSFREQLADGRGMLFPFSTKATPTFWMKDMRFPIDIIWIDSTVIVGIESNVPVDDGATLYSPTQPVDSVLELPGGWASRHGTSVGDRIE